MVIDSKFLITSYYVMNLNAEGYVYVTRTRCWFCSTISRLIQNLKFDCSRFEVYYMYRFSGFCDTSAWFGLKLSITAKPILSMLDPAMPPSDKLCSTIGMQVMSCMHGDSIWLLMSCTLNRYYCNPFVQRLCNHKVGTFFIVIRPVNVSR